MAIPYCKRLDSLIITLAEAIHQVTTHKEGFVCELSFLHEKKYQVTGKRLMRLISMADINY